MGVMGAMRNLPGAVVAVAVAALVAGGAGCSSGDDDDGDEPAAAPSSAAVLADRLGCESGRFELDLSEEWYGVDVRECQAGAVWARIYASLDAEDHDRAVEWLTDGEGAVGGMRDWCVENEQGDRVLYLVTGTGWVAVVVGEDRAKTAADRLGGTAADEPLPNEVEFDVPFRCLPNALGEE
jgi:hypothetical protein